MEIYCCANRAHRVILGIPEQIDRRTGSCRGCTTIRAKESPEINEEARFLEKTTASGPISARLSMGCQLQPIVCAWIAESRIFTELFSHTIGSEAVSSLLYTCATTKIGRMVINVREGAWESRLILRVKRLFGFSCQRANCFFGQHHIFIFTHLTHPS